MKKIIIPFLGIAVLLLAIIPSCNKTKTTMPGKANVKVLVPGNPIKPNSSSGKFAPEAGEVGIGGCNCDKHGGTSGAVLVWTLATCRSDCERGIGFRCGRAGYLRCQDGTIVICGWGQNCPSHKENSLRRMEASYEFFDNGTMKLTFLKPVLEEERNSPTGDIFEVEQRDYVQFSSSVSIHGKSYRGFDILDGNYKINYSDGQYGSVVIGIEFKE